MSYIRNRDTDSTRTRPMNEREFIQLLNEGEDDYGKVLVGTDSTYGGEIALAKDSDVITLNADDTTVGSVLKTVKDNAANGTYDGTASGIVATTITGAIDEVEDRVDQLEARELTNKVDATAAPTVNDDSDAGYEVGSLWVDIDNDEAYRCADSTVGAAAWVNTTLTADELSSLLISHDPIDSQHTATTVKGALEESAILAQTVDTQTVYDDNTLAQAYKMYADNEEIILERIS